MRTGDRFLALAAPLNQLQMRRDTTTTWISVQYCIFEQALSTATAIRCRIPARKAELPGHAWGVQLERHDVSCPRDPTYL